MLDKYQDFLSNAPINKGFGTDFGEIKNLRELRTQLFANGKKFFKSYVNTNENHFASWIENVLGDYELSNALKKTNSFGTTLKILDNRIKYLELWLVHNKEKENITNFAADMQTFDLEFEPEHHQFETISNHDLSSVHSIIKKDEESFEERHKRDIDLLRRLQENYESANKKPVLNFFERFGFFRK